jgi:hypothetical protein
MLTIRAATQESGLALSRALATFYPELELDDGEGRCLVSVELDEFLRSPHASRPIRERAWAAGTGMSLETAPTYALSCAERLDLSRNRKRRNSAAQLFCLLISPQPCTRSGRRRGAAGSSVRNNW